MERCYMDTINESGCNNELSETDCNNVIDGEGNGLCDWFNPINAPPVCISKIQRPYGLTDLILTMSSAFPHHSSSIY